LLLEWDITSAITLYTLNKYSTQVFSSEDEALATLSRSAFSPKWDTLAIWALALNTNKPPVVELDGDLREG
jgi:hypothetical protein